MTSTCFLKKYGLFIFLFLLSVALQAQSMEYKKAINDFQRHYNNKDADAIFNSFSPNMQHAISLKKTKSFIQSLHSQLGAMEQATFIEYSLNTRALFKSDFKRGTMAVYLSLDTNKQLNLLLVKPYETPIVPQYQVTPQLDAYPQAIADSIFTYTKAFPNATQLAIAVVQDGQTSYYGIIKEKNVVHPISNEQSIFEIGSITKVFTSSVLASLVHKELISLDGSITPYYPYDIKENPNITFKSLANHTSGLPRLPDNLNPKVKEDPYQEYNETKLKAYLQRFLPSSTTPAYIYSNLGAGILGYTLARSQETTFPILIQEEILTPYGLSHTYTNPEAVPNQLVLGLDESGNTTSNWHFDTLFAAGGLLSCVADLAVFANAQFNPDDDTLALTRIPTVSVSPTMQIGLGWHIITSKKGQTLYWHNGGTGGYSSSMAIDTANKTAVVILSNVSPSNTYGKNIDKLCFGLLPTTEN